MDSNVRTIAFVRTFFPLTIGGEKSRFDGKNLNISRKEDDYHLTALLHVAFYQLLNPKDREKGFSSEDDFSALSKEDYPDWFDDKELPNYCTLQDGAIALAFLYAYHLGFPYPRLIYIFQDQGFNSHLLLTYFDRLVKKGFLTEDGEPTGKVTR